MHRQHTLLPGFVLIAVILLVNRVAAAQPDVRPGSSGTTVGSITEITDQYLRIQEKDDQPHRHWFKWASGLAGSGASGGAQPDAAMLAMLARLKVGDQVTVRWMVDDRRRIESIRLTSDPEVSAGVTRPADAPQRVVTASQPATGSANAAGVATTMPVAETSGPASTTSERVNALLDNLLATGNRILDLPLFVLLAGLVVIAALGALIAARIARRSGRTRVARIVTVFVVFAAVFAIAVIADRKIARLQNEIEVMRTKSQTDAMALLDAVSKAKATPTTTQRLLMFDPAAVQKPLAPQFGEVTLQPTVYDDATDVVRLHVASPLTQAYLAVIDLTHPGLTIKLAGSFDWKTLTSQFARENDCTVAINGEAGTSPGQYSGLGPWRGHFIKAGQVLLREDAKVPRPFLSFDKANRGAFTAAAATDRAVAASAFNVIWGRLDAVVNGVVQTDDERYRQPRTAMAISADGTRLYLLVVDGRQPRYSMGFTRAEVGYCLKAFGAANGMLCDEGGSSCIYLRQLGGITNVPSDNQGQERPTYTHFGISLAPQAGNGTTAASAANNDVAVARIQR